jgi:hypothetical protein
MCVLLWVVPLLQVLLRKLLLKKGGVLTLKLRMRWSQARLWE